MKIVLLEAKKFAKYIVGLVISIFLFALCNMILPTAFSNIIDTAIPAGDAAGVWKDFAIMAALALVMIGLSLIAGRMISAISMGIGKNLEKKTFDKVMTYSATEIDKFSIASLISRTNGDIREIKTFLSQSLMMLIYAPILCIIGLVMSIATSPELSVVLFVAVPILLILLITVIRYTSPLSEDIFVRTDNINLVTREKITGTRVIRAFGTMHFERKKFKKISEEFKTVNKKLENAIALLQPLFVAVIALSIGAVFLLAFKSTKDGSKVFTAGQILLVIQYILFIMVAIMMLTMVFMSYPRALACSKRIAEVLSEDSSIVNTDAPKAGEGSKGMLEFKDVVFTYKGADVPAVNHLSFKANPGEVIAIVGGTGMGKSSIINLIPRIYDVTEGQILLDGVDIRDYDLEVLRKKIGFVPQKACLFKGTINSNISFGDDNPSEEKVRKATEIAQSLDFVEGKKDGFNSPVAQGGENLSGGQKQRLCIARALTRDAEVYIFDDSFSALDFRTDKRLRQALKEVTGNAVTMIVAQRISTIMDADQIIVIDKGNIVGIGKHSELLGNCDVYREIAESQLSEEELKNA